MTNRSERRRVSWTLALPCALALACARPAAPPLEPVAPEAPPPPTAPEAAGECTRILSIEVRKGERSLSARCEGGAVHRMTAALGREPRGDKLAAGDDRTPEGLYRISGRPRRSRFHLFIPIDYPSADDARAALDEGRISPRDHARILYAETFGLAPPDDTPLGSGLGLHGEGGRWRGESAGLDWTNGCVAVTDADIEFLAARVEVGKTEVVIQP
ncbi:MAG TPA: L,D-transpeptidase [Myxococcota bacterium]|nr:L,D-transpeptidase [Myxococcota bacterium]